jgi:hypothetical protein
MAEARSAFLVYNFGERDRMADLDVDEVITLKWNLE